MHLATLAMQIIILPVTLFCGRLSFGGRVSWIPRNGAVGLGFVLRSAEKRCRGLWTSLPNARQPNLWASPSPCRISGHSFSNCNTYNIDQLHQVLMVSEP
ncbi:hypothetical protein BOTBODRAFT_342401 [Botryobasidium botryosum FD-172 SS1]|uniref:Secreted protein n=1 Tax=Botryobasidium botryosum (strain FD-172 SS1) TaxID=930990 RepID=A0A067MF98_BOTB1|nr:hypothetical protein BOTBODRAFT_342401 [Botryobasidium botryosum FD-172 SS1]